MRTDLLPREQYFALVYWYQLYEKLNEYLKKILEGKIQSVLSRPGGALTV